MIHERAREHRRHAQEADLRYNDANKRLIEIKNSGIKTNTAEQILNKLQSDVKELNDRKDNVDKIILERETYLEKLQNWENSDKIITDEDIYMKKDNINNLENNINIIQEKLDIALERNNKLIVFRQASTMALKKFREREDEVEKLMNELKKIQKLTIDKENEFKINNKNLNNKINKNDLKKYGAIVREKIEKYKKMREELSNLRNELVILQRTEQILKSRHKNLDEFLDKLASENGVAVSSFFNFLLLCFIIIYIYIL